MSEQFSDNILGSSVANFIFICIIGIGVWIRSRLAKSNCKIDCGVFECDSSIIEIKEIKNNILQHTETQRGMLEDILKQLKDGTD